MTAAQPDAHTQEDDEATSVVPNDELSFLRRDGELRQLGACWVVLGLGAAYSTLSLISTLIQGQSGAAQIEGYRLSVLLGNFIQLAAGLLSMVAGMIILLLGAQVVKRRRNSRDNNDPERKPVNGFHVFAWWTIAWINLGPITLIVSCLRLAQGAQAPVEYNPFLPMNSLGLTVTKTDVRVAAAMGMLALISVCATLIGGLTVVGLHVAAHLGGQPHSRHCMYHVLRLHYYSVVVVLGGFSQLLFGLYLWGRFGPGPYKPEPVHVAVYTISFAPVAAIVGALQVWMGVYGWRRARLYNKKAFALLDGRKSNQHEENCIDPYDYSYLKCIGIVWLLTMALQCLIQPAYADGWTAEGATVASVYLGFFVMPALLDQWIRTTPVSPRPVYYGLKRDEEYKEDILCKCFGMAPDGFVERHSSTVEVVGTFSSTKSN